ncbi:MAG TPA: acyl-CoA thioesterase [Flavobacteriales bacterium]|nr:acyl-CoA thioesterase [Flavobacteriales bacterium]
MNSKTFPIQIRFSDIDAMGIAHNAIYFEYFEQARLLFFKELVGTKWDWSVYGVIVARNETDYLEPVFLNEEISVEVFCTSIGNTSFSLGYRLIAGSGGQTRLKAKGQSVIVCYNHQTKNKTPVYDTWRNLLYTHRGDF